MLVNKNNNPLNASQIDFEFKLCEEEEKDEIKKTFLRAYNVKET